jgi:nicotinamide mononucleotide transporter
MTLACARDVVVAALAAIPPAEWAAVILALAYLLLAVRQSVWCWACAIASSAIYLVLFAQGGLVMQAALQVFYIGMGGYGWWAWRDGAAASGRELRISRWSLSKHLASAALVLGATAVNGWIIARAQGGLVPYVDSFVAWASVVATWMVARKVLENWLYWIVVDAIAAALYWSQGFHATAGLFLLYVAVAVHGFFSWRAGFVGSVAPRVEQSRA